MTDSNRFNKIVVVDSIPEGQSNTARRLFEDIDIYAVAFEPSPTIVYERIKSANDFLNLLAGLTVAARESDSIPMLHIECHGDEDGFQFADDSILDWPELKTPFAELNEATQLNLMIAVGACIGGAAAKTITFTDRAPFWGLIGPTQSVHPTQIEKPFRALYTTLLRTKSPQEAIKAFEAEAGPGIYWRTTAQGLFEKGWLKYKAEYCSPEVLQIRAARMLKACQQAGKYLDANIETMKEILRVHEPTAFARFRRTFFMEDLFPGNESRFNVSYEALNKQNES